MSLSSFCPFVLIQPFKDRANTRLQTSVEQGHIYLGYVNLAVSPPGLSSGATQVIPESYPIKYENTRACGTGEIGLFLGVAPAVPFFWSIQANDSGWEVGWKLVLIPSNLPATCIGGCRKVVLSSDGISSSIAWLPDMKRFHFHLNGWIK